MKNRFLIIICFVFVLVIVLTACSTSEKKDPLSFDSRYLNQQIKISPFDYVNTFTTKGPLRLHLEYNSSNKIVFPNNYGLRIFEETKDDWQEIKEKPTVRIPSGDIILSPEVDITAVDTVGLFPELTNFNKSTKLCIYVIGQMMDNGEAKSVAAYTNVVLYP